MNIKLDKSKKQWVFPFSRLLGGGEHREVCDKPQSLEQRSPTFLAPGTSFTEDNFPRTGEGHGMAQAGTRAMGSGRRSFARSPAAHLLLCGPLPNGLRRVPVRGPGVGDPCSRWFWFLSIRRSPGYTLLSLNSYSHKILKVSEKLGPLRLGGGTTTWCSHCGRRCGDSSKN